MKGWEVPEFDFGVLGLRGCDERRGIYNSTSFFVVSIRCGRPAVPGIRVGLLPDKREN
jgi:hypothetical protein